jgi:DNA modification methylase
MATRANVNRNTGGNDVKNAEAREPMGQTCSKCGARRVDSQIGLERTPEEFVAALVGVFREVRRVLREDGTLWLNLGDSYASFRDGKATPDTTRGDSTGTLVPKGEAKNRMASTFAGSAIKHKDLVGIPWRVAFALQQDGWYLRQDIIWQAEPHAGERHRPLHEVARVHLPIR